MNGPGFKTAKGQELWESFLKTSDKQKSKQDDNNKAYRCPWTMGNFFEVTEFSDMVRFEMHAAHVLLWCRAKETDIMTQGYPLKYRVTMQLRFDGTLGFPGGLVDEISRFDPLGKTFDDLISIVKKGLIREVEEEMALKIENDPKYIYSSCFSHQLNQSGQKNDKIIPGWIMHFFTCEVPISALEGMEKNMLEILAGDEVLGLTRVPLYFMENNIRGLPSFLTNAFVGNALEQLIRGCLVEGILTEEEVRFAYFVASTLFQKMPVLDKC